MNRLKIYTCIIFTCISLALAAPVRASCSLPDVSQIANGLPNNADPVRIAFNTLGTCVTTVDNSQIGLLGIFASQIIPTTIAQGTFGGSLVYNFNNGIIVRSGADGVTPLFVKGNSATQSVSLVQIFQSNAGVEVLDVGQTGNLTTQTTTDATPALVLNGAPDNGQSADFIQVLKKVGGTLLFELTANGSLLSVEGGGVTKAPVGPAVLINGAAAVAGTHDVVDSFTITFNGNCAAGATCNLLVASRAFTNDALGGTGVTHAACRGSTESNISPVSIDYVNASPSGFNYVIVNRGALQINTGSTMVIDTDCKIF